MGNLMLGKMIFMLLFGVAKATPKAVKAVKAVSSVVMDNIEKIEPKISQAAPQTIKRKDLKKIYQEQKKEVLKHREVSSQVPYVVCHTTVLGNYLSEKDWQAVATEGLSEKEVIGRIERSFDTELHERVARAAQRVGFVNTRQQIPTGVQQYVSFSDGLGHGVKIAIHHKDDTEVGVDLVGYQGAECHSKQEELTQAFAAEGIGLEPSQVIDHGDPEGYQGVKKVDSQNNKRRQYQARQREVGGKR